MRKEAVVLSRQNRVYQNFGNILVTYQEPLGPAPVKHSGNYGRFEPVILQRRGTAIQGCDGGDLARLKDQGGRTFLNLISLEEGRGAGKNFQAVPIQLVRSDV